MSMPKQVFMEPSGGNMTAIEHLDQTIRAQCPSVAGVSIGRWNDKSSWRVTGIDGEPTASDKVKAAAVFSAFSKAAWEAANPPEPTPEEKIAALEARLTALERRP